MKNITTPRNLAECNFAIGYPAVEHYRPRMTLLQKFCVWFVAMVCVLLALMAAKVI